MDKYIVLVTVGGRDVLTDIHARSCSHAEHQFLDAGIYAGGVFSCIAALAFDAPMLDTDTFRGACIGADFMSTDEVFAFIKCENERLREIEAKKQRIADIKKQIEILQAELASLA